MLHFLFPSDPLDPKEPDDIFREQAEAVRDLGFGTSLFSLEELQTGTFKLRGPIPQGATVVYRGWMMDAADYQKLASALAEPHHLHRRTPTCAATTYPTGIP